MRILAIDTSCDDTCVAVTQDGKILANIISSQTELHNEWGGVVPNIARRAHEERIDAVVTAALKKSKTSLAQMDVFAVTRGPGLAIALGVGIDKARQLSVQYKKPLVAVNHMEGHIYSCFVEEENKQKVAFPLVALLVSGGHTELVLMKDHGRYEILGETLDDATGEAFDKVARMLGLGYPGGAVLATLADAGNADSYPLPVPMTKVKDLNFSFSGIKTAMMRLVSSLTKDGTTTLTKQQIADVAASFQKVAVKHLIQRTLKAVEQTGVKLVAVGGGVSANLALRKSLRKELTPLGVDVIFPIDKKLCMDNAAMIAAVAYQKAKRGEFVKSEDEADRDPGLRLHAQV